jgi:hypothetical protein
LDGLRLLGTFDTDGELRNMPHSRFGARSTSWVTGLLFSAKMTSPSVSLLVMTA